jgi:hypothetical protein
MEELDLTGRTGQVYFHRFQADQQQHVKMGDSKLIDQLPGYRAGTGKVKSTISTHL